MKSNRRSISLLTNKSKTFEKIIYNGLMDFAEKCSIIMYKQNGFRKIKTIIRAQL